MEELDKAEQVARQQLQVVVDKRKAAENRTQIAKHANMLVCSNEQLVQHEAAKVVTGAVAKAKTV